MDQKPPPRRVWRGPDLARASPQEIWEFLKRAHKDNDTVFFPIDPQEALARFQQLFRCQRGGVCCTRENASKSRGIGLTGEELERLARIKRLTPEEFRQTYCFEPVEEGPAAVAMRYPCPFYRKQGDLGVCTVHAHRPFTCRVFPLDAEENTPVGTVVGVQQICPGGMLASYRILLEVRKAAVKEKAQQKARRKVKRA